MLMRTRCSGVDCRDMMTAPVAAISDASTKKCDARNVEDLSAGRAGTSLSRAIDASLVPMSYPRTLPCNPCNPWP